jgi:hypothetical protein
VVNDFEANVFKRYPAILELRTASETAGSDKRLNSVSERDSVQCVVADLFPVKRSSRGTSLLRAPNASRRRRSALQSTGASALEKVDILEGMKVGKNIF